MFKSVNMVSKSKRLIGLSALLFILLNGLSVAGQRRGRLGAGVNLAKEFDCPEEFGYYSHPTDCTMYYVCVFGGALLESCTGGLMYSQELQTCDWPRNVGCGGSGEVERVTVSSSRARLATVTVGPTSRGGAATREQTQRQQQDEIAKHQLYADDVGPAEEIENDRQQRVYRGQPATITLGQNLDTRHQVTNAIPVPPGREKIAVISFGTQQQQPQHTQYSNDEMTQDDSFETNHIMRRREKRQIHYRYPGENRILQLVPSTGVHITWPSSSPIPPQHQLTQPNNPILRPSNPVSNSDDEFKPLLNPSLPSKEYSALKFAESLTNADLRPPPNSQNYNNQKLPVQNFNVLTSTAQQTSPGPILNYVTQNAKGQKPILQKSQLSTPAQLPQDAKKFENPLPSQSSPIGSSNFHPFKPILPSLNTQLKQNANETPNLQFIPIIVNTQHNKQTNKGSQNPATKSYVYFHLEQPGHHHQSQVSTAVPSSQTDSQGKFSYIQTRDDKPRDYLVPPSYETPAAGFNVEYKQGSTVSIDKDRLEVTTPRHRTTSHHDDEQDQGDSYPQDEHDYRQNFDQFDGPPPEYYKEVNKYDDIENPFASIDFDFDKYIEKLRPKQEKNESELDLTVGRPQNGFKLKKNQVKSQKDEENVNSRKPVILDHHGEEKLFEVTSKYNYNHEETTPIPEGVRELYGKTTHSSNKEVMTTVRTMKRHRRPNRNRQSQSTDRHQYKTTPSPPSYSHGNGHTTEVYSNFKTTHVIPDIAAPEHYLSTDPITQSYSNENYKVRLRNNQEKSHNNQKYFGSTNAKPSNRSQAISYVSESSSEPETTTVVSSTYLYKTTADKSLLTAPFYHGVNVHSNKQTQRGQETTTVLNPQTHKTSPRQNSGKLHRKQSSHLSEHSTLRPRPFTLPQQTRLDYNDRNNNVKNFYLVETTPKNYQMYDSSTVLYTHVDDDSRGSNSKPRSQKPSNLENHPDANGRGKTFEQDYLDETTTKRGTYSSKDLADKTYLTYRDTKFETNVPHLYRNKHKIQDETENKGQFNVDNQRYENTTPRGGYTTHKNAIPYNYYDDEDDDDDDDYYYYDYNDSYEHSLPYKTKSIKTYNHDPPNNYTSKTSNLGYELATNNSRKHLKPENSTPSTVIFTSPLTYKHIQITTLKNDVSRKMSTKPVLSQTASPVTHQPEQYNHFPNHKLILKPISSHDTDKDIPKLTPHRLKTYVKPTLDTATSTTLRPATNRRPQRTRLSTDKSQPAILELGRVTRKPDKESTTATFRVDPTPASSTYVTKATPGIYNGSQQYDLTQFDPYYNLYDEDVELYRDIDYSQFPSNQGNSNNNNQYTGQNYKQTQQAVPQQEQRNAAYAQPTYNNQDVYAQTIAPQDYNENNYNNQQNDDQVHIGRQPTKLPPSRQNDIDITPRTRTSTGPSTKYPSTTYRTTVPSSRQQMRLRVETSEVPENEYNRPAQKPTTSSPPTTSQYTRQPSRRIQLKTSLLLRDPFKLAENQQSNNRNSSPSRRTIIRIRDEPDTQHTSQFIKLGANLESSSVSTNGLSSYANNEVHINTTHAKVATRVEPNISSTLILDSVLLNLEASLPIRKETFKPLSRPVGITLVNTSSTIATPTITVEPNINTELFTKRNLKSSTVTEKIWQSAGQKSNNRIVVVDFADTVSLPEASAKSARLEVTQRKFASTDGDNFNYKTGAPIESSKSMIQQSSHVPLPSFPTSYTIAAKKSTFSPNTRVFNTSDVSNQAAAHTKQNVQSRITLPYKPSPRTTVEITNDYRSYMQFAPKEDKGTTLSPVVRPFSQLRKAIENKINADTYHNSNATRTSHKSDSYLSITPSPLMSFVNDNSVIPSEATSSRSRPRLTNGRPGNFHPKHSEAKSHSTSNEIPQIRIRPTTSSPGYQATPDLAPVRAIVRGRGSASYTTEPSNRGTPAAVSRARPTLKPSTAIVSKEQTYVDIFRYSPSRPQPVYATPQVDKTAAKCRKDVCLLPDCSCGGKEIPGDLSVEETPQIVLLTFDDAINDLNKDLYSSLFEKGRKNPNGCPIAATYYVSHEWTDYSQVQNLYADGHEMASHSISHSFGEQFSQKKWTKEISGQREILAAYGGVRLDDIRGMRAPFLAVGGNKMFKMLYDSNFTYDSSMPVYENKPPSWPYTFDYKIFHDCMIPPCPTRSYPGVWEVPMVMWQDLNGGRCSMGDACSNPPTSDGVYKMLIKNFERHFTSNRAPFGLYYHAAWFTQPHHKEGFEAFLDTIVNMPEVWLVTNWQALQWVRDPTPLSRLNSFQPFQCNYPERPRRCNNPKVCNLWHKSGVRYMRTCQACPDIYPWTGKSGVRNSRVDNEIIEE